MIFENQNQLKSTVDRALLTIIRNELGLELQGGIIADNHISNNLIHYLWYLP